jgi:hypothetical protein
MPHSPGRGSALGVERPTLLLAQPVTADPGLSETPARALDPFLRLGVRAGGKGVLPQRLVGPAAKTTARAMRPSVGRARARGWRASSFLPGPPILRVAGA